VRFVYLPPSLRPSMSLAETNPSVRPRSSQALSGNAWAEDEFWHGMDIDQPLASSPDEPWETIQSM